MMSYFDALCKRDLSVDLCTFWCGTGVHRFSLDKIEPSDTD